MIIKKPTKGAVCIYRDYWTREAIVKRNRGSIITEINQDLICLVNDHPDLALLCCLSGELWLDIAWNLHTEKDWTFDNIISVLELCSTELTAMDILNVHAVKLAKFYEVIVESNESINAEMLIIQSIIRMAARFGYGPDNVEFTVFKDAMDAIVLTITYNNVSVSYEHLVDWYEREVEILDNVIKECQNELDIKL